MINPFDLEKRRELLFTDEPKDQVTHALVILSGLPKIEVHRSVKSNTLDLCYNLRDYTLEDLERAIEQEGFHLNHSFMHQIGRNIIYYCEDTTRHNMEIRGHVTKKNESEVFVSVHEQHHHQEHASKPPELREYE
jgi:hypothetical protein